MNLRKLYLQARVFLYSARKIINSIVITAMILILVYIFLNSFLFPRVINSQANNYEISNKYTKAIDLYDFEYQYYSLFHFSQENKDIYFEIPYKKAICYLKTNQKQKSIESMLQGITTIQRQYGIFSRETASFMRKYLIEYYLENNNYRLASQEFDNLVVIYKTIGYNDIEMADMVRLSGDLYYAQKKYDVAMDFYKKAYNMLSKEQNIDYGIFTKIVERITKYEIANKDDDIAIEVYQSSISLLQASGKKQNQLTSSLLLQLGDYYSQNDKTKKAIRCYEKAIELIKTLPRNNYERQNKKVYMLTLKDLYNKDGQFHKVAEIDEEFTKEQRFPLFYQ